MTQATISFKTDSKIKKDYENFAKQYGLTPSALLNIQMRQLLQEQVIVIGQPKLEKVSSKEITKEMKSAIKKAKKTPKNLLHNI